MVNFSNIDLHIIALFREHVCHAVLKNFNFIGSNLISATVVLCCTSNKDCQAKCSTGYHQQCGATDKTCFCPECKYRGTRGATITLTCP